MAKAKYVCGVKEIHQNNVAKLLKTAGLHLARQEFEAAHAACIAALKLAPDTAEAFYLLGVLTAQHDKPVKAGELFSRAIDLSPENARYHAYYAQILTILGKQKQAKAAIDVASKLAISDALTADKIGVVYSRTGYHEKAVPFFEKAIALNPKPANFHYNLGASQQFLGKFERAKLAYRETLERAPEHYRAWSSLIGLEKQGGDTVYLPQLETLFARHKQNPDAALHYGHAIAKTHEDMGNHPQSLKWLRRAKQGKLASLDKSLFDYEGMFKAAKQSVTAGAPISGAVTQAAPIFVFGLPRTGTTLVDRIISSHHDVTAAGELNAFAGLIKAAAQTSSNLVMDGPTLLAGAGLDLSHIGRAYIEDTRALARGAPRMTDKMPLNFFYAGLIHRAMPNARIIALRRGAMDSCMSNYRQLFTTQYSYYNYTYDLEHTARFYKQFHGLMKYWKDVLPANRFMEVRYEDIVFDQENQTRRLLEFCDLPWDEACMRFHENKAPVSTASSVQVRKPLYSGSIGRWKKYGAELDDLRRALGDLAEPGDGLKP